MILKLQTPYLRNNIKKLVRNYQKIAGKKRSKKLKRSDIKYFLTIHFLTETTQNCANFVGSLLVIRLSIFLLILKKGTVQWLNCTYLKYELNHSYNGGKVVYLLKVRHLDHPYSRLTTPPPLWERFSSYFRYVQFSHRTVPFLNKSKK